MRSFLDDDLSQVKLIASDMDFTFLKNDKSLPSGAGEQIGRLAKAGVRFAAASGRPLYTLQELFAPVHPDVAFIADNGGVVSVDGELVFKSLLSERDLRDLVDHSLASPNLIPIVCGIEGALTLSSARRYEGVIREFYRRLDYVDTPEELIVDSTKFTVFIPEGNSLEVFDQDFGPSFSGTLSVTSGGDHWLDAMNLGVTKGTGLRRLCDHLGISIEDAVAVGDTDNDIQMLQAAGHGYLVANADRRMEPYARWEVPSNEDEGVIAVMKAVLAARGQAE